MATVNFQRTVSHRDHCLRIFKFSPRTALKCLELPDTSVMPFSVAVAAMTASPARIPVARPYSST